MAEPLFVLFSGANDRALLAVIRSLVAMGGAFKLISRSRDDKVHKSRYRDAVFAIRQKDALDANEILALLASLRKSVPDQKIVLIATAESLARFFLAHRPAIEALDIIVPLPDEACYFTLSNKHDFLKLAEGYGLSSPPSCECVLDSVPFVAKPFCDFAADGNRYYPQLILQHADFERFRRNALDGLYFFQRYIRGTSCYFLYFRSRQGKVVALYQQNLLQQPNGKSMLAARLVECPDAGIDQILCRILADCGFTGFVMFECMKDKDNEEWYLIECNPRIWGPFQMAVEAGFDPRWLAGDVEPELPAARATGHYLWLSGIVATLKRRGRLRYHPEWKVLLKRPWSFLTADVYLRLDSWRIFLREVFDNEAS